MSKERILRDIAKVERAIKSGAEKYVCIASMDTESEREITQMVKRHIGGSWTANMRAFLAEKFNCKEHDITNAVAKSYRLCMLRNMKKMVEEEYK